MKAFRFIMVFTLLGSRLLGAEDAKPVMPQVAEEIHKITVERGFTDDDATRIAQHLFTLLVGPSKGKPFADATEPDAKHIEVEVGYDTGIVARSYRIRFFREPVMKQHVYIESITVVTNNT